MFISFACLAMGHSSTARDRGARYVTRLRDYISREFHAGFLAGRRQNGGRSIGPQLLHRPGRPECVCRWRWLWTAAVAAIERTIRVDRTRDLRGLERRLAGASLVRGPCERTSTDPQGCRWISVAVACAWAVRRRRIPEGGTCEAQARRSLALCALLFCSTTTTLDSLQSSTSLLFHLAGPGMHIC